MKAYETAIEGSPQNAYNYCHTHTKCVVGNAFGRLKGRFWTLAAEVMLWAAVAVRA